MKGDKKIISVFGLGYVGCVCLGCLAKNGNRVIGVDVMDKKIDLINQGKSTIIEKDIDEIIGSNWGKGLISATKDYRRAVEESDISLITVGTPATSQGHLNLDYLFNTARQIGAGLRLKKTFHIIVIRSTVYPGTSNQVEQMIERVSGKKKNNDFAVVNNPEFLREGSAIEDYFKPAIIVLGSESTEALKVVQELYKGIQAPVEITSVAVAEMIKYVSNSFHALKVTFANEIGNICKKLNIDSHSIMDLFTKDTRLNLSPYYLKPGFAYGGSCLPKDLKGLLALAHDSYVSAPVLEAIEKSNQIQKKIVIDFILNKGKKKIGILGLSFKKGTDDLRYSPMVEVVEHLIGKGKDLFIYDAKVNLSKVMGTNKEYINEHIPHLADLITGNLDRVIEKSELLVIAHQDELFKDLEKKFPEKIILDLVKVSGSEMSANNYHGICW